ncbi:MAG: hypothetical protein AB7M05_09250 [Alphaproteobacteria bacterium]
MIRPRLIVACALIAAVLAGCGSKITGWAPPGPPSFQAGYKDGCWTGWGVAGKPGFGSVYYKNDGQYLSDPEYKKGWDQGQLECYQQQMSSPQMGGR